MPNIIIKNYLTIYQAICYSHPELQYFTILPTYLSTGFPQKNVEIGLHPCEY